MLGGAPIELVVVGASAGAIDALSRFLPLLPADLPAPVVIVVHLPPKPPSMLCRIFADRCALAICEAHDKQELKNGTVYFAPPDYHLLVEADHSLALSLDEPVNFSRPSIDVLFESAAEAYGERLLALILTGASKDGAHGAAEVRRLGGIVAVQDPSTAEASLMPRSAIEYANPQRVGTLAELAAFTLSMVRGQTST